MNDARPVMAKEPERLPWGVLWSVSAYGIWGLFPIYFKAVASVPALQVLAHRIVWSLFFLAGVITVRRNWRPLARAFAQPRLLARMAISATAIALNWLVFIWAVAAGRLLECSLGYFLTPLVSVTLAVAVLRERLRMAQWAAVTMAALGVLNNMAMFGSLPWLPLTLAISFGGYGLLRKTAPIDAIDGLFIEAALLTPPALAFLVAVGASGEGAFWASGWRLDALLAVSGPLTALPLILFVAGARRIRLATLGLLQYITPTCQFLLAVDVYHEAFAGGTLASFVLIWAGLALYTADAFTTGRG